MAHRHEKAGQYGKREAIKRQRRIGLLLFIVGATAMAGVGFIVGYFQREGLQLWGLPAVVLLVAGVSWVMRHADRSIDRWSKERLRYLRGGQAEGLVAWLLEDLPNEWHIFNGVKLESGSDNDHVVVGPGGVFCISTKSRRGLFTGTALGLLHNGKNCDFAHQVQRQTMNLRDRLDAIMGKDVPWIQSVLALPLGWTENDAFGGQVWVVNAEDMIDRIAPEKPSTKLGADLVKRLVKAMEMIQANAAEAHRRPDAAAAARVG
ncbi:MAG TPA: nuclease-related domain-containing protein [Tepidisphaeraceae bacterium]|jgi:hypothetical protein|nr:nuclease-related domain-containing protein [Tepidisphaeraceae bacterium]